jgi:hypothetical protein
MTDNTSTKNTADVKTAFVKAEKAFASTKKLTVVRQKEPPKRTVVNNPLTKEQRDQLKELIAEWVTTANLVGRPLKYGFATAYSRLYEEALYGDVNGIEQIEQEEYEACYAYLSQRIMVAESNDKSRVIQKKSNFRSKRIGSIQSKCKQHGISEEKRRAYLQARFGVNSLTLLSDDELEECYRYSVSSPPPKWNPPDIELPNLQALREKAFSRWLDEKEAEANRNGEPFNRQAIAVKGGKEAAINELAKRDRILFEDDGGLPMSLENFNKFLTKAKLGKFKGGRPSAK